MNAPHPQTEIDNQARHIIDAAALKKQAELEIKEEIYAKKKAKADTAKPAKKAKKPADKKPAGKAEKVETMPTLLLIAIHYFRAEKAKQMMRAAGFGVTGTDILETTKQVLEEVSNASS